MLNPPNRRGTWYGPVCPVVWAAHCRPGAGPFNRDRSRPDDPGQKHEDPPVGLPSRRPLDVGPVGKLNGTLGRR
jgi:hypothetical protein